MAKYIRYSHLGDTRFGLLEGVLVHPLEGQIGCLTSTQENPLPFSDVQLLSPTQPSKIVSIGPNFPEQLFGGPKPAAPMFWIKPSTTLNHPEGVIKIPSEHPRINHESEIAAVIGKVTKDITAEDAAAHIFGFTCMNDVTAGDFSSADSFSSSHYFVDGKIFDTFSPLGPWIETELDPDNVWLECRINGEVRQRHSTNGFLFSVHAVVAMASRILTLLPGDVIAFGAPPGVGVMRDGDVVEVEVEGIGILRNTVAA